MGYAAEIAQIENPRVEAEEHYYNAKHQALRSLGLTPHLLDENTLGGMIEAVARERDQVDLLSIVPNVGWRKTSEWRQKTGHVLAA